MADNIDIGKNNSDESGNYPADTGSWLGISIFKKGFVEQNKKIEKLEGLLILGFYVLLIMVATMVVAVIALFVSVVIFFITFKF